jgi:prevent-host-death family protein
MDQIIPSAELRNHYKEVSELAKSTQEPIFITVNGKGDSVLLSLEKFNQLSGQLDLLLGASAGQWDIDHGNVEKAKDVFADLIQQYSPRK